MHEESDSIMLNTTLCQEEMLIAEEIAINEECDAFIITQIGVKTLTDKPDSYVVIIDDINCSG